MTHLLKNNIFRAVFVGLISILGLSIAFLPRALATDVYIEIGFVSNNTLENGTDVSVINLVVDTAGKYTSINGFSQPYDSDYPQCTGYLTLAAAEVGSGIPAGATVNINSATGEYSITSDEGIDLSVGDEVMRFTYEVSPDAPGELSGYCYAQYSRNYTVNIGGVVENFEDNGNNGMGLYVSPKIEQDPTFNDLGPINKVYGDSNFSNIAPTHTSYTQGEISYASGDENVAIVNSSTGEVHITGAGSTTITATAARYYNYLETSTSYTLNVTPKSISISDVSVPDKTYDGTTDTEVGTVTLSEAGLVRDVDYTVSGVLDNANVGTDRKATVTVTLIGDAANNYVLTSDTFEVDNITISPYTITSANIFLEYYATGHDGTEKEPGVTVKIGNFAVDPNEYTVGYTDNIDVGTATVTVAAKDGANIASSVQETFEIVDRDTLNISGITSPQTITYTGLPVVLEGTLTVGPNTDGITVDDINIIWYESDGATVISQPTDAGSYVVKYYYSGVNYIGELLVTFTIERAESPEPAEMTELNGSTIRAGKRLSEIEGVRTRGFRWESESTIIRAGRNVYRAIYVYNDDAANYTVRYLDIIIYGEADDGGDDGEDDSSDVVIVPDTGYSTSVGGSATAISLGVFVGVALIPVIIAISIERRYSRNKINFDKK